MAVEYVWRERVFIKKKQMRQSSKGLKSEKGLATNYAYQHEILDFVA